MHFDAAGIRFTREHNVRAWQAHATASLMRTKKIPSLRKLQIQERRQAQTPEEMKAAAHQWVLFLGGKIRTKPN